MASAPLLSLNEIALTFGGEPVLDAVSMTLHEGAGAALVGRNGSGKSTLMKVIAGEIEPDAGTRVLSPGVHVAMMEQQPDFGGFTTLGDYALDGVAPAEQHKIERAFEGVKTDPSKLVEGASGGERRRAALARMIGSDAALRLFDEPTNHLDIDAILWLERYMASEAGAFVVVSHDRAFLNAITNATLWMDRGQLRQQNRGFAHFEAWRDKTYEEEDLARHKEKQWLKAEGRWAVEGISARRKRNMGRVRRLAEVREARSDFRTRQGTAKLELGEASKSGRLVAEAKGISKAFGDAPIVTDFSIRIMRGDRLAIVGPNGVGKTTLINMLTGRNAPDSGAIRHGTGLEVIYFEQNLSSLDMELSVWENMTQDPSMGVVGSNDQIMVRGKARHVVGYLKDFLFAPEQMRSPVRALSGGERVRLLLAKLMARDCNLLVLDEPTNDLDVETLDLLQELLDDFDGTVLLVSHDRDFVDRVVDRTLAMEKGGRIVEHAGGYSDYLARRAPQDAPIKGEKRKKSPAVASSATPVEKQGLSFTQAKRLDDLPAKIDQVSAEIAKLEAFLADPELFTTQRAKFDKASAGLVERQERIAALEEEWLELEALREADQP